MKLLESYWVLALLALLINGATVAGTLFLHKNDLLARRRRLSQMNSSGARCGGTFTPVRSINLSKISEPRLAKSNNGRWTWPRLKLGSMRNGRS